VEGLKLRRQQIPPGINYENATFAYLPNGLVERQREIIGLYRRIGVDIVLTRILYSLEVPRRRMHLLGLNP